MKRIAPFIALLSLVGCATWGQLDNRLDSLNGKPLSVAVDKLGFPSSEQLVAGMRLVRWSTGSTGEYHCTITLQVDQKDIVVKNSYEGNLGGCQRYIFKADK